MVQTGVDGRSLTIDDELRAAISDIRRHEDAVARRLDALSPKERERALRTCVAGDLAEPKLWAAQDGLPTDEFVARCVSLRGPVKEGRKRRDMRERARLYLLMSSSEARQPSNLGEHHQLWETLMHDEPFSYPPHKTSSYRTGYIPFTAYLDSVDDLRPGLATIPEEDIEQNVLNLLSFLRRSDVECELRAAAGYYLHGRIHPFFDGNGHTGRALACVTLGDYYSIESRLALVRTIQSSRGRIEGVFCELTEGHGDLQPAAELMLDLLAKAQEDVLGRDDA